MYNMLHVLASQIQVAHLEPDAITLVGEGVFPCIGFNLPSNVTDRGCTEYDGLRKRAEKYLSHGKRGKSILATKRHGDSQVQCISNSGS